MGLNVLKKTSNILSWTCIETSWHSVTVSLPYNCPVSIVTSSSPRDKLTLSLSSVLHYSILCVLIIFVHFINRLPDNEDNFQFDGW